MLSLQRSPFGVYQAWALKVDLSPPGFDRKLRSIRCSKGTELLQARNFQAMLQMVNSERTKQDQSVSSVIIKAQVGLAMLVQRPLILSFLRKQERAVVSRKLARICEAVATESCATLLYHDARRVDSIDTSGLSLKKPRLT